MFCYFLIAWLRLGKKAHVFRLNSISSVAKNTAGKMSWCLIKNLQWFHAYKCWNRVSNRGLIWQLPCLAVTTAYLLFWHESLLTYLTTHIVEMMQWNVGFYENTTMPSIRFGNWVGKNTTESLKPISDKTNTPGWDQLRQFRVFLKNNLYLMNQVLHRKSIQSGKQNTKARAKAESKNRIVNIRREECWEHLVWSFKLRHFRF